MQTKLYIGNLAPEVSESFLREYFLNFGEIVDVEIVFDRQTSRSREFGFVTFQNTEDANKALSANGELLAGKVLRVSPAQSHETA